MTNRPAPRQNPTKNPQEADQIDKDMVRWTRAVAVFTALLFITSAVANFFIYKQWQASIAAQNDSRDQLRAVVIQAGITAFPANVTNGKPSVYGFVTNFQNIGGTRTSKFTAWSSIHYFQGSVPNSQDFSKPYDKITTNDTIIAAGGTLSLNPVTLVASDIDDVRANIGVAVMWGHAEWADIFDKTVIHEIDFCVYVTPQVAPNGINMFAPYPVKPDCNKSN